VVLKTLQQTLEAAPVPMDLRPCLGQLTCTTVGKAIAAPFASNLQILAQQVGESDFQRSGRATVIEEDLALTEPSGGRLGERVGYLAAQDATREFGP
jgi:hypothetical protein